MSEFRRGHCEVCHTPITIESGCAPICNGADCAAVYEKQAEEADIKRLGELKSSVSYYTFSVDLDDYIDMVKQCPECGHAANELFVAAKSQGDADRAFELGQGACPDCYVRLKIKELTLTMPTINPPGKTLMEAFTGVKPSANVECYKIVQTLLDAYCKSALYVIGETSGDTWTDTEKLHNTVSETVAAWNCCHTSIAGVVVPAELIERMAEIRSMQQAIQ